MPAWPAWCTSVQRRVKTPSTASDLIPDAQARIAVDRNFYNVIAYVFGIDPGPIAVRVPFATQPMEQTLQALGAILLKAIPTIVLVLILHFYFKKMLFGPLDRVLKQRDEATSGARRAAEESFNRAERRAAEYEAAIRDARADVYREQEAARNRLLAEQQTQMKEARARMESMIQEAKTRIHAESEAAKHSLADSSGVLADQIADTVLARRAS